MIASALWCYNHCHDNDKSGRLLKLIPNNNKEQLLHSTAITQTFKFGIEKFHLSYHKMSQDSRHRSCKYVLDTWHIWRETPARSSVMEPRANGKNRYPINKRNGYLSSFPQAFCKGRLSCREHIMWQTLGFLLDDNPAMVAPARL